MIRYNVARVGSDGTLDATFNPEPNGQVDTINLLSTGQVLIGGSFTALQPNGAAPRHPENHVAILNSDGTINLVVRRGVNSAPSGQVNAMAQQSNGQLILGGSFGAFGDRPDPIWPGSTPTARRHGLYVPNITAPWTRSMSSRTDRRGRSQLITDSAVWLESNGAVRYTFTDATNGQVSAVAQQADGRVLVGGVFTDFSGNTALQNLVRIQTNGMVDSTFVPQIVGQVNAIVVQPNGQIVVGGTFSQVGAVSTIITQATALVKGDTYVIDTLGTTDFTQVGALSNTIGAVFTATGAATGTGAVSTTSQHQLPGPPQFGRFTGQHVQAGSQRDRELPRAAIQRGHPGRRAIFPDRGDQQRRGLPATTSRGSIPTGPSTPRSTPT